MKVLITGAGGFIGKNLIVHLAERGDIEVLPFVRGDPLQRLEELLLQADFVFHLAGVNRPKTVDEFRIGNANLTQALCRQMAAAGRRPPVIYASSTQADQENPYGESKRAAEDALSNLSRETGTPVHIFRLPNVFGKWSRPDYNSAVATFCHNMARDLPVKINDPNAMVTLVYVDDLVARFLEIMDGRQNPSGKFCIVEPQYKISVGELESRLRSFRSGRDDLTAGRVGEGLDRALYATYVSFLPPERFSYAVPCHEDSRGKFVEMLKTRDSGQFSFFTAYAGVTRGGHYHHSKTEKFLVIKGNARFRFRHVVSGEQHELQTSGDKPEIVETVPGWAHDVTNVGNDDMIVMLWANEVFDRARPDTIERPI